VEGTPHGRNLGKVNPLKSSLEEFPPMKEGGGVCVWGEGGRRVKMVSCKRF